MSRKVLVILLLCTASVYDIQKAVIPANICMGIMLTNILYSLFYSLDLQGFIIGAGVMLILFIIHRIYRKGLGLGDVLLLGFTIPALSLEEFLSFVFLVFFISSIYGLGTGIYRHQWNDITVPLAPCITLAFMICGLIF